jgi:hypothetical protein
LRAARANGHSFSELSAEFARPRARANYDLLRPVGNPVRTFDAERIAVFINANDLRVLHDQRAEPSRRAAERGRGKTWIGVTIERRNRSGQHLAAKKRGSA